MSKFDYSSLRATAITLIDKFGRTTTKRTITSTGDKWNPTQSEVETPLVGAFTNYSKNEVDNSLILSTDKKLLTYDEILLTDIILDDSIEYAVKNVDSINPGDTKLIYKIQLRA